MYRTDTGINTGVFSNCHVMLFITAYLFLNHADVESGRWFTS